VRNQTEQDSGIQHGFVWILFLGAFVMGTSELVAVGLVPEYASRSSVSLEAAGGAVGFYAFGMFLVGPILALASSRIRTKPVMVTACLTFVAGCVISLSPSILALFSGRLISGAAQGVFLATSFQMISATIDRDEAGTYIARVLAGISVACAVGLPAGTAIGAALGVATVTWIVGGIGLAVLIGVMVQVPDVSISEKLSVSEEVLPLRNPTLALRLVGLALMFSAAFTLVTQIAVFGDDRGFDGHTLTWILLGFGLGAVCGTFIGGRLARRQTLGLRVLSGALPVVLAVLLIDQASWMYAIEIWLLAVLVFATIPLVQTHASSVSSGRLVAALPASSINIGIVIGSVLAGQVLAKGADWLVIIAVVPAVFATVVLLGATVKDQRVPLRAAGGQELRD